ncbi:TPA: restriction alleviation protein, Lar family [Enterobacter asburiae]|nr:Lar family restriction alleviation protein [Enterobacter asburiae]HAS1418463.1 restriction alleviation protein, Lar family [Enterobacter asburiae]
MSLPKPCPFCGSGNIGIVSHGNELWYFARCHKCGANGPEEDTRIEAALAWKRRAGDEANNLPSK